MILLGKFAGVHGLEWHECDAFEAPQKKNEGADSDHDLADFFRMRSESAASCHSSSRTPTILPKKNAELQYGHMIMDLWTGENLFFGMIWMDGFL